MQPQVKTYTAIAGSDLVKYIKKTDPEFARVIDPSGVNLVTFHMIHNDVDIRAVMLVKLYMVEEPHDATIDFPIALYNSITYKIEIDVSGFNYEEEMKRDYYRATPN